MREADHLTLPASVNVETKSSAPITVELQVVSGSQAADLSPHVELS